MGVTVSGLGELQIDLEQMASIPDGVVIAMAEAGGKILMDKQKESGEAMGVHDTGLTLDSMRVKANKTRTGAEAVVTFDGARPNGRKTKRNAEVAFMVHYGVKSRDIPSRPFVTAGNDAGEDEACDAAAKIYYDWLGG